MSTADYRHLVPSIQDMSLIYLSSYPLPYLFHSCSFSAYIFPFFLTLDFHINLSPFHYIFLLKSVHPPHLTPSFSRHSFWLNSENCMQNNYGNSNQTCTSDYIMCMHLISTLGIVGKAGMGSNYTRVTTFWKLFHILHIFV